MGFKYSEIIDGITGSDLESEFEIIANSTNHEFNIGEIVTLVEICEDGQHKFANKDDYWWCKDCDVKKKGRD